MRRTLLAVALLPDIAHAARAQTDDIDHRESTPPGSSGWTYIFGGSLAWTF